MQRLTMINIGRGFRVTPAALSSSVSAISLRTSLFPSRGQLQSGPQIRSTLHPAVNVAAAGRFACTAVSTPCTKRRVRHILVPAEESKLLAQIQEELESGAEFEDLAAKHSICPSAKQGGEMGWIKQGMGLPPSFEGAIFDADVEDIFATDSHKGLHIVQVLDEKEVVEMQTMTVQELAKLMKRGKDAAQYIDVREEGEFAIAKLPHFDLLPLSRFSEWAPTLTEVYDPDKPTVCLCHAGMRSRQFANLLIDQGFSQVYNISGGIEAYSCLVDAKIARY